MRRGRSSSLRGTLILPLLAKRPTATDAKRSLLACVVQTAIPAVDDFHPTDLALNGPAIRRKHRNHLSAALAAVERMLALRETHKKGEGRLDWLILPELAVHPKDVRTHLVPFARAHRAMILTGLANYVIISHGGGQLSLYWHMRKGSVAVKMGDDVVAGQSIGMTASSGYSTGPHLHFETWVKRVATEPFAGRCNPGASGFVKQLKFKRNTYLLDAGITHQELRTLTDDELPPEQLPSSGQFQTDDEWFYIWFLLQNLPAKQHPAGGVPAAQ